MKTIQLVIIFCFYTSLSFCQYQLTQGTQNIQTNKLIDHNGTKYLAASSGLFSSDENDIWQCINNNIGLSTVRDVITQNNTIYAVADNGVWKADSGQLVWDKIYGENAVKIAYNKGRLFLGTYDGFFYSDNNGTDWENFSSGFDPFIRHIDFVDDIVIAGGQGLFTSQNNGDTWEPAATNVTSGDIQFIEFLDNKLLVPTQQPFVNYISYDLGETFNEIEIDNNVIIRHITKTDSCYIIHESRKFYKSIDLSNWERINADYPISSPTFQNVGDIGYVHGRIYWSSSFGLLKSNQDISDWSCASEGLTGEQIFQIYNIDDELYIAASGGAYKSTDNGQTWIPFLNKFENGLNIFDVLKVESDFFFTSSNTIFKYSNGSVSTISNAPNFAPRGIANFGDTIIINSYPKIARSPDLGASWEELEIPSTTFFGNLFKFENRIFYYTEDRKIYYSLDKGDSWIETNGLPENLSSYFVTNNGNLFIGTTDGKIYESTNMGDEWTEYLSIEDEYIICLYFLNDKLFIGTTNGVFMFQNGDLSKPYPETNEIQISSINGINDELLIGTTNFGVLKKRTETANENFVIDQVVLYPNPVSNILNIYGFEGPSKFKIFDLNGISQLNGSVDDSIDVSKLPVGTYFLSLNNFENSKNKIFKFIKIN